jgi:hypothetical protein
MKKIVLALVALAFVVSACARNPTAAEQDGRDGSAVENGGVAGSGH